MPLAFNSISHGEVAFGFFNIETDMLILDRYFFFATEFCRGMEEFAKAPEGAPAESQWSIYDLNQEDIGSLMGAIHGIELRGFIGDVYRVFPFPADFKAFAQNPEGRATQQAIREIIERYQAPSTIPVIMDGSGTTIEIGDYMFSREEFHNLLQYVWVGGYPYWKMGRRPDYVLRMKEAIEASKHPLFDGVPAFA